MKKESTAKFALISVTDKNGIVDFAKKLAELGYKLVSTGGTARILRSEGQDVIDVADFTGAPEMLGGRVKTLHPKIHGGILYDRTNPSHGADLKRFDHQDISLVVCNLYKFTEEAVGKNMPLSEAIEYIDIGGVTLLRAAAKNFRYVLVVCDPDDYQRVISAHLENKLDETFRTYLAKKAFKLVAEYDQEIHDYFGEKFAPADGKGESLLPGDLQLPLKKIQDLRYGENPHQRAAWYRADIPSRSDGKFTLLHGKELSYNNLLDLDAAMNTARELLPQAAAVIVKHTNPCGAAVGENAEDLCQIYKSALGTDSKSPFGGIVAITCEVDEKTALEMSKLFLECIVAPSFAAKALQILQNKKDLRLVACPNLMPGKKRNNISDLLLRSIGSGILIQTSDNGVVAKNKCQVVTSRQPTEREWEDMIFGMKLVKHVKSNAIVIAKDNVTLGIGAGQMNRVGAAEIAISSAKREGLELRGSALASDAFFPFGDTVALAAKEGISAIIQPGGSKRDQESIDEANKAGVTMVFTGERHFRH